ncbi:MAG: hypothetical protein OXH95_08965 [bacterium]|nr:hypothetical protein [bacterium]MCY3651949.1 hypothetical protein [bacterium]MDE0644241.1 hypothetical protein [bacterium]MYD03362.1 hypothetical protein [Acidimicrobiia bacterium]
MLAVWLPDLDLPLGDSDDGRILARFGLSARNFWDMGAVESGFGARIDPYIRGEYGIEPGQIPPEEAVTYAHHPPLQTFITIASVGLLGDNEAALRVVGFLVGSATVLFMVALARQVGMGWGPTLLGVGAMASTGFYLIYGRLGVGFSLIAASAALVAYLRSLRRPPGWLTVGGGVLACLTAMQSWIAMGAIVLLVVWLYTSQGLSTVTRRMAIGALLGIVIVGVWLALGTDPGELGNQVTLRTETADYPLGEFLARQWRFAGYLTPIWLRLLAPIGLIAGLLDRRTRIPTAITLVVAAAWTFGLRQGAWVHVLWNFPWLAPITLGLTALADRIRLLLSDRWEKVAGWAAAVVIAATFYGTITGPIPDNYLHTPAQAGAVLSQVAPSAAAKIWVTSGISSPRWVSFYLDKPVWAIETGYLDLVEPDDLILTRTDRKPNNIPLPDHFLLEEGRYQLFDGTAVIDR